MNQRSRKKEMNVLPQIDSQQIHALTATAARARVLDGLPAVREASGGIPLEVLYSFVSLHGRASGGHVVAFTSARRQEGVTHGCGNWAGNWRPTAARTCC